MSLAFHLSGEHASLPLAEVESIFSAYDESFKITLHLPPLLVVESDFFEGLRRLAFCHRIVKLAEDGDFKTLLDEKKRFRVRCFNLTASKNTATEEKRTADEIQNQFGGKLVASMRNPEQEISAFLTERGTLVGKTVHNFSKMFSQRIPTRRPFFHPSTMHPKLARCLVNLTGTRREIFDPFCGSGAILIEAGLMGIYVFGMDLSQSMIEGTRRNLEHYGIRDYRLWSGDACSYKERRFEAVTTDLPYGRSTLLSDSRETLYEKFFENLSSLTDKAVVVLPEERCDFADFMCRKKFVLRVHRSLNRYIYMLERR